MMNRTITLAVKVTVILLGLLWMQNAGAATKTWVGASGGSWATAANWSPASVPTTTDDLVINPTGSYTITGVNANYTVATLTVGGSGTLTISGATSTRTITVTGNVNINGGTLAAGSLLAFTFNGAYNYAINGGIITTATWGAASTLNITGITSTTPTGLAQALNHVTINNASAQTIVQNGTTTIAGTFTLTNGVWDASGRTLNLNGTLAAGGTGTISANATTVLSIGGTAGGSYGALRFTGGAATVGTFTLNRTGTTPSVDLGADDLIVQNALNLTSGVVNSTSGGTLTLGVGSASTLLTTRVNGSLNLSAGTTLLYNLSGVTYNLTYGAATATNTAGPEMPGTAVATVNALTISNTATGGTKLGANANATSVTISASSFFDLNAFTLGVATTYSNSGTLTANAANSKILLNGTAAQTFAVGTYTGTLLSNLEIANTNTATGATVSAVTVGNLTVNSGAYMTINNAAIIVRNSVVNDGNIINTTGQTSAAINMGGAAAQTISGSGVWAVGGVPGLLQGLVISNTSGGVDLQVPLAIYSAFTLTSGNLTASGSGALTLGAGAGTTLLVTRTNGTLGLTPSYNLAGNYNVTYGVSTASNTTGSELPGAGVGTIGTLTVNNTVSGGTKLGANTNVTALTISASSTLDLNNFTLGIATTYSNSGTITANAASSKILLNGSVAQTFSVGTYTGTLLSNLEIANTNAVTGATVSAVLTVGNLTVNNGAYMTLGNVILTLRNNIANDGTLMIATGSTAAAFNMNGTLAQTIAGGGTWMVGANTGYIMGLTINNTAGIDLQLPVGIYGALTLTAGTLTASGSGALTMGAGVASTLTVTRTAGTLSIVPTWNLTNVTMNVLYGTGANISFTSGNEIPDAATAAIPGAFTLNTTASGTVTLNKSITVNGTWTNTTGLLNIGANVLTLGSTVTMTAGNWIGGANSEVVFTGTGNAALVMNNGTPGTSNLLKKFTVNKTSGTSTITTTALIVSDSLNLYNGVVAATAGLTINGVIATVAGTINGGGAIVLGGTQDNMGSINLASGAATFTALTFSNSSTAGTIALPTATITGNLTLSNTTSALVMNGNASGGGVLKVDGDITFSTANATFTLTSGIVHVGNKVVRYTNNAANFTNLVNSFNTANEKSYFSVLGANSGFNVNVVTTSPAANTLKFPIGPAGAVSGYRPVTLQTTAAFTITRNLKVGFINHTGGTAYSSTNLPATDALANDNVRAGYIANILLDGAIGSNPHITMTYQDADFNTTPSAASAVQLYNNNGLQWTSPGAQTGNGTANSNITVTRNAYAINAAGTYPLILAEVVNDPGMVNTWTWTGNTSANWNVATNWIPASVPNAATANVIIDNPGAPNPNPVLNQTAAVNNITVGTGCTLTTTGTVILTVNGTFTNTGTVTPATGSTIAYAGTSQTILPLTYFTLTTSGATTPVLSPTGTITIKTAWNPGTTNYSPGNTVNSTVMFDGPTTFTYNGFPFYNLIVNTATLILQASTPITVANDLTINAGAALVDNTNLITGPGTGAGTFTINGNGILTMTNTATADVAGNYACFPKFSAYAFSPTSTVNFNAVGAQNIYAVGSPGYGNLSTTTAALTSAKTAGGSFTVQGNLTVANGTSAFFDGGNTITVNGNVVNTLGIICGTASTVAGTGKILMSSANAQTISGTGVQYGNIEINNTHASGVAFTGTAAALLNVYGGITVTSGLLTMGNFTTGVTVAGPLTVGDGSSTATLTINGATGTKTFNGDVTVNANATYNTTAVAAVITYGGATITNSGTFNTSLSTGVSTLATNTKTLTGANAFNFGLLTVSIGTAIDAGTTLNVASTFNVGAALTNNGILNSNATSAIAGAGSITNATGASFTLANASITPTLVPSTSANLVTYTGTAGQTIRVPTTNPYFNLTVDKASGTATMGGAFAVSGDLTINNGTMADGALLLTGPGAVSGKTFAINNSGAYTMTYANANPIPVFQNYSFSPTSTITHSVALAQNVAPLTYGNLVLTTTNTTVYNKTLLGNVTVAGTLTVNNYNTVVLGANTLTMGLSTAPSGSNGLITIGATSASISGGTTSNMVFNDNSAANATASNLPAITGGLNNLTINRAAGITLTGANTVAGVLAMDIGLLNIAAQTLTITGTVTNGSGPARLYSSTNTGVLTLGGTTGGNLGSIYLANNPTTINTLNFNRSGATPSATIEGNLTLALSGAAFAFSSPGGVLNMNGNLSLTGAAASFTINPATTIGTLNMGGDLTISGATSTIAIQTNLGGKVNMGSNSVLYSGATMPGTMGTTTNYFAFLGSGGGFQWNMPNNQAAGTYRLPIGPAGDVAAFRPVTFQTTIANSGLVTLKVGFINHATAGTASATEIPLTGNNRAAYLAQVTRGGAGTITAPNVTMAYADADFGIAPTASNIALYRWGGSSWSRLGQTSNAAGPPATVVKNTVTLTSGTETYALGETGGIDLPGNTYVWTGATSTAWDEPTNWDLNNGAYPNDAGDNVVIDNTYTPSNWPVIANAVTRVVKDISIGTGATLTVGGGTSGILNVNGTFTNSGTLTGANGSTVSYVSNSAQTIVSGNYFNLTCNGGTGARTLSTSGVIGVASTLTLGSNTYTTTGSTIDFNGSGAQTIPTQPTSGFYQNVEVSTGGTKTLQASTTINGNLTINTGATLADAAAVLLSGPGASSGKTFTINGTGIFTSVNTSTAINATNIGPMPVFQNYALAATSTVNLNASAATPVAALTYGNLSMTGTSVTKTAQGPITVAGNFSNGTSTLTFADGGNTITVNGNVALTGPHTGAGKIYLTGGSAAHTLTGTGAYTNLQLEDANGATMGASFATNGTLTLTSGALSIGSNTLTINGGFAYTSGTITGGTTSNLTFASTGGSATLPAISGGLQNFNVSRTTTATITLGADLSLSTSGTLTIGNTTSTLNDGGFTLTVRGGISNLTGTHASTGAGKIYITGGTGAHTITATTTGTSTYGNLEFDDAAQVTNITSSAATTGIVNVAGNFTVTSGTVNLGAFTTSFNVNSAGSTTSIASGASLVINSATGAKTFAGDFTNNGTYTASANAAVTIGGNLTNNGAFTSGAGAYTFSGSTKTISGTTTTLAFGGNVVVSGSYTNNVANTSIAGDLTGAGSLTLGTSTTLTLTGTTNTVTTLNCTANTPNTVVYNRTAGAQTVKGTTYYNLTIDKTGQVATLGAATTINNNLTITNGTLADGTFLLTGPGTGSGALTMSNAGVLTFTNTSSGLNTTGNMDCFPLFQTNTFNSTGTAATSTSVNFNANAAQRIPAYNFGNLAIAGGNTKTAQGGVTLTSLSITAGTFADNGNTIEVLAGLTNSAVHSGTGKILLDGTSAQTISGAGTYGNLELDNSAGATMANSAASFTVAGALTLTSGNLTINTNTLTMNGTIAGSGTLTGSSTSSISVGGTGGGLLGTLNFTTGAQAANNFTMNRTGTTPGVTLGNNLSVAGVLALTSGIINVGANVITVTNTATASVTNTGGSASYVNGALARTLPASLAAGQNFIFPVGKSAYQNLTLNSPTTSAATLVLTAEVFDADVNGLGATTGAGVGSLNTDNYWLISKTSGSGTINSVGSIALTDAGVGSTNIITQSATVGGTYAYKGGLVSSPVITSTGGINNTLGYFAIGTKNTNLCPGPYTIGPTGDFGSIADVASILNGSNVTCDLLFELQPTYTSSAESFPITFANISNGANTITFRPDAGASGLVTSGDGGNGTALITINGVDNMVFDGRADGAGTTNQWTIQNTRTASTVGPAIQLTAGADNNTLQYLNIRSSNTQSQSGTVHLFPNTTANTNDTIQYCVIGPNGSNNHMNAICAFATGTINNTNMYILNNDIHDFIGSNACGILVSGSSTNTNYGQNFTITGNSLYRTVNNTLSDGSVIGINFIPSPTASGTSTGNTISGNYIGGTASARASGVITGTWISSANNSNQNSFMGIQASARDVVISNNTIGGIFNIMYSNQSGMCGIDVLNSGGTVTVSDNTIGTTYGQGKTFWGTTSNSITMGAGSKSFTTQAGLGYQANDNVILSTQVGTLSSNFFTSVMLGTITSYNSATGAMVVNVTSNLGSGTFSGWNITLAGGLQNTGQFMLEGIWVGGSGSTTGSIATCSVTNNTIGNLTNTHGNSFVCAGIITQNGGPYTVSGNTVFNLSNQCAINTSQLYTGNYGSVVGISQQSIMSNTAHTVSGNTVHTLIGLYNSTNANSIYGIELCGTSSASYTQIADANLVYNLSAPNAASATNLYGIFVRSGVHQLTNNMVRLGIRPDATASSITGPFSINGIYDGSPGNSAFVQKYYHNSVYIGGTTVATGSVHTYAFRRVNTNSSPKNPVDVRNNIFVNNRSNTSGTGRHFAIGFDSNYNLGSTGASPDLSIEDYNVVTASGTNGAIAQVNTTVCADFAALRTAAGNSAFDLNSTVGDPQFIDATSGTPDLHINAAVPSPVEAAGTASATTGFDIDGDDRTTHTPVDIGADAGDFLPLDITPPSVNYTLVPDICNTGATSTAVSNVAISDPSGINTVSGTRPRIYYKRLSDATNSHIDNTSGTAGWKYVEANGTTSPFDFTINYNLLNGGVPVAGESIQYFVVAQDLSATNINVAINSGTFAGTAGGSNTLSNFDTWAFPVGGTINSYAVLPCSGTVTVGTGGNYPGFTPNGALFQAINATSAIGGLTGNLTVNVLTSAAVEDGVNALNQWTGAYTVTVQPADDASVKVISNVANINSNAPMIPVNGADGFIINGNYSGAGQYLGFRNTNTTASATGPTIQYTNGSTGTSLLNTIVESNATNAGLGTVTIGNTGTNTITITGNSITSPSAGTVNNPANAIYSNSATNTGVTVAGNDISNFTTNGILLTNGANWTIGGTNTTGNNFFQTSTATTASNAISIAAGTGHTVTYNSIGGSATGATGTWTNSGAVAVTGIALSGASAGTVTNNTIQNFNLTSSGASSFIGINNTSSGAVLIQTNTIGAASNGIAVSGTGGIKGIYNTVSNAGTLIGGASSGLGNTISNLSVSGTGQVIGIHAAGTVATTIQHNTIHTLTNNASVTGTGAAAAVIGILQASTSAAQTTANNNIYALGASANAAVSTAGIVLSGAASHTVSSNFIHNFVSSSATSVQLGINIAANAAGSTLRNNMIALGVDASGTDITNSVSIAGITKSGANAANIYNNSVYIGGATVVGGTVNTYAYQRTANANDDVRNNIFVNARSNTSGTALHYAYVLNSTTITTSDYNIYYAPNSGGAVASFNGGTTALNLIQGIRFTLSGKETHSAIGNPNFVSPAGAIANLHLQDATPAEGAGELIASVTDDFDGDVRASNTPTDIGADAHNFDAIINTTDIFTPAVTVSAIAQQAPCGGTLNIPVTATVTDAGVGVATGSLAPTLWWRLAPSGSWTAVLPTSNTGSTYNFTMSITGATTGQTYHYYVAAQDQAIPANIAYSHFNATTPVHTDVSATASPENAAPASFNTVTVSPLSGSKTVGSGGDYATFNGASGLFAAINANGLSSDLTVTVISNVTETAQTPLNQVAYYCGGPWKILIQSDGTTQRVIAPNNTTTSTTALIHLNGADNVTVDGSFGTQTGQYLLFRNSNAASGAVFYFTADDTNIVVKNCDIQGMSNANTGAVVYVGAGTSTGNRNITFAKNNIHACTTCGGGNPLYLFWSNGNAGAPNQEITLDSNNLYDFSCFGGTNGRRSFALNVTATGNGGNWTIKNNHIYNTFIDGVGPQTAMSFLPGSSANGNLIRGNYIGGRAPFCAGSDMNNNTSNDFIIMQLNVGNNTSNRTIVDSNTIQNITAEWGDGSGVTCMEILGSSAVSIKHNTIGSATTINSIRADGGSTSLSSNTGWLYGIASATSTSILIDSNIIGGLTSPGVFNSYVNGIEHTGSGAATITNNLLTRIYNSSNGSFFTDMHAKAIVVTNSASGNTITGNTVEYIGNACDDFAGVSGPSADGIQVNSTSSGGGGTIANNMVNGFWNATNGGNSAGIIVAGNGSWTVANNMVNMYNRHWSLLYTTRKEFYGILDLASGGTNKFFYNTVLVQGAQSGSSSVHYPSSAFYKLASGTGSGSGDALELKNNIFINSRTGNPTTQSKHYAIDRTSTSVGTWSSDYNFLSTATNSTLGYWQGSADRTFAQWQSSSGGDANSQWAQALTSGSNNTTNGTVNPLDLFIDPVDGDLHIKQTSTAPYQAYNYVQDLATTVSVTDDYDTQARPMGSGNDIGADEFITCTQPTITLGSNPSTCTSASSQTVNITYSGTTQTPDEYSIVWAAGALSAGFSNVTLASLPASPISITVPAGAGVNTYTGTLTVKNSSTGCVSTGYSISVTVTGNPTITLGTNPSVCYSASAQNASLSYSATTGSPNQYSISGWSGGGFADVTNATLPATPIVIAVPAGVAAGTYTATLTVRNSGAGCVSTDYSISVTILAPPAITAYSPVSFNNTICALSNTSFGVTATGAGLTYVWEVSSNGGTSWSTVTNVAPYSGATTAILAISNTPSTLNGYQYRAIVSGTCTPPDTSDVGNLTVNFVSITSQPAATTEACEGSPANISAGISGGGTLDYHWQLSTDGGTNYANISNGGIYSGANTASLDISAVTSSMAGYKYRVYISAGACVTADTSTASTIVVNAAPAITSYNPSGLVNTVCAGSTPSVAVTATGTSISYVWEVSTNSGGSWSTVTNTAPYSGATTNSLSIGNVPASMTGYLYRVTVSGTCSPAVTSDIFTLNVVTPPTVSADPANTSVCAGATATVSASATVVGNMSYQWQYFNGSIWVNVADGTPANTTYTGASGIVSGNYSSTMSVLSTGTTPPGTYQYRCQFTTICQTVNSASANVVIASQPSVSNPDPAVQAICTGGTLTDISVTPSGGAGTFNYQWFSNTTNATTGGTSLGSSNGAQTSTYTPPATSGTVYYYCEVTQTGTGCNVPAPAATASVTVADQPVTPTIVPTPNTATVVCPGTDVSATFTGGSGGAGTVVNEYEYSINGGSSWATYTPGTGISTTGLSGTGVVQVRARRTATGGNCNASTYNNVLWDVLTAGATQWTGNTSTDWNTASNWCPGIPDSTTDVIITNTTNQPVITTAAFSRDLAIANGANVTLQPQGKLSLFGNLTINSTGAYTHTNGGVLELTGAAVQIMPAITADSVLVNKRGASQRVRLAGSLTVLRSLRLHNGVISTGASIVDVRDTMVSAVSPGTDLSWINGTLRRAVGDTGIYHLPVGDSLYFQYAQVDLRANSRKALGGIDSLVAFFNTDNTSCTTVPDGSGGPYINSTPINNMLNGGFWTIHPDTSTYTGVSYNVTLKERGFTNAPAAADRMGIIKRESCAIPWVSLGTHINATQQLITNPIPTATAMRSVLTTFSDFGIGFNGEGALPVTMLYIEAEAMENTYIQVRWATALEIDNYGFEVERSTDGVNWNKIGFVAGNNNSVTQIPYSFDDKNVTPEVRYYYRLKQVDNDGDYVYTDIVTAIINAGASITMMDFRPNPAFNQTNLVINSAKDQEITIEVFNIVGQRVMAKTMQVVKGTNPPIELSFATMASGTYSAVVSTSAEVFVTKLVITK